MTHQLATRFARSAHQISGREALDNEALFRPVPTIDIVEQLRGPSLPCRPYPATVTVSVMPGICCGCIERNRDSRVDGSPPTRAWKYDLYPDAEMISAFGYCLFS